MGGYDSAAIWKQRYYRDIVESEAGAGTIEMAGKIKELQR